MRHHRNVEASGLIKRRHRIGLRRSVLKMVHRQVVARKRSVLREVSLHELAMRSGPEAPASASLVVSPGSSPSTQARRQELSSLLAERLSRLPGPCREVLVLRHLEGLSFPEVADRMGRPVGAVRVLWLRALERMDRRCRSPRNWPMSLTSCSVEPRIRRMRMPFFSTPSRRRM